MSIVSFILLGISVAALVVARAWRWTIPLLFLVDLARIGLLRYATPLGAGSAGTLLLSVELLTSLSVGAILLVTAWTLARSDDQTEPLDEFALMELRRAARRAQQQRTQMIGRWSGVIVPIGAIVLAGLATLLLGRAYPIARSPLIDAGWIFTLLCGLFVLVTAADVLKLGIGMLLIVSSAKLLYVGLATQLNVFHIGLLQLATLMLAVVAAALSGLLYGRLRTLEIDSVFERRR